MIFPNCAQLLAIGASIVLLSPFFGNPSALSGLMALPEAVWVQQSESIPSPLTVMSFNIRYGTANDGENRWENRRERVFDLIRRHDADVLGLQEALRFQVDEIREALPHYSEVGVGRDDGRDAGEFSSILFKQDRFRLDGEGTFWYSETPEVPGSKDWGNQITRICSWARLVDRSSDRRFGVFNTHWDHQSQNSREKSALLLIERIRALEDVPVLVMGDFNAGETNSAIQLLKGESGSAGDRRSLRDSYRQIHPEGGEVGTFNGFAGRRDGEKIDYIFVTEEVKVLEAEIVRDEEGGRYPSDHFPVKAIVALPGT